MAIRDNNGISTRTKEEHRTAIALRDSIRPGDILVEKSFVKESGDRDVVSIFLVLNRHMESEHLADSIVSTIYYKTFLLYVEPNDWADVDFRVNSTYYLSEHEITDHHMWEKLFESDLSWNDSYPRT